jgi:hypothetical protein
MDSHPQSPSMPTTYNSVTNSVVVTYSSLLVRHCWKVDAGGLLFEDIGKNVAP